MGYRHLSAVAVAFLAVLGCVALAQGVTLEVMEGNKTCIKANLTASFSIIYNTANGTNVVQVALPDSAEVGSGSACGGTAGTVQLVAMFGGGHSLSLAFGSVGGQYSVANLSLQYNLSDTDAFPLSSSTDTVTASTTSSGISAGMNTTYRCLSALSMSLGESGVNMTLSEVRLQAYMPGTDLSTDETVCAADQAATTAAPTAAPTVAPTPPPVPGNPERGSYNVTNSNGTVCLLARMGLQFNITYHSRSQNKTVVGVLNLQPNRTSVSGTCETSSSTLQLADDGTDVSFIFTMNATNSKFSLSAVKVSADWSDMAAPVMVSNSSLDLLKGTLGRSYMCNSKQTVTVASTVALNTFGLQVQPFEVTGNDFATAEECQVDQESVLIPIIVGAALAGLVLIVLIAYLIGRKRSHAGYQTI